MLDFVACLPPSGGDGSEKCECLIDRLKAEVESSYVLIGAFETCNVFLAQGMLNSMRGENVLSCIETFQFLNVP